MNSNLVDYNEEVRAAIDTEAPLVALESTIISHGMPYPQNKETAAAVEDIIRRNGAVPATLAIVDGRVKAGLTEEDLERLAKADGVIKASRRDLPVAFSRKLTAATTVASTMICADMAGIRVFATGGTGGVHRGAQQTFDVSADLQELAKTNVAVVSAGAKSILDLRLTLEYLETLGVPVLGYGTDEFPAFYTRTSGLSVDYRVDEPAEIASILRAKWGAGLSGGVLIANPIPAEHSMDPAVIEGIIQKALADADASGVRGKELTPFLLAAIKEKSEGESLEANIELVYNNAALAAKIAAAYGADIQR